MYSFIIPDLLQYYVHVLQTSAAYVLFYIRRIDGQPVLLRRMSSYTHRDPSQDEPDKKEVCMYLTFYYNYVVPQAHIYRLDSQCY